MDLIRQLFELLLASAAEAFIQVGVFVGAVLLLFQYINFRQRGALIGRIEKASAWQPAIGALLGLTPGCGGAIFVMTLYLRGSVTFGTVVATLISTMGDAAFVIIAAAPVHFLYISAISLLAAVITGYAVDWSGLGSRIRRRHKIIATAPEAAALAEHFVTEHERDAVAQGLVMSSSGLEHVGHSEGDAIDLALHHQRPEDPASLGYRLTHRGSVGYWLILAVGLAFGMATVVGADLGEILGLPSLTLALGIAGTLYGVILMAAAKRFGLNTTHEDEEHKLFSLRETLVHGALDTAFVTTWVFVSFLAYNLGVLLLGGGDVVVGELIIGDWMQRTGLATVVVGAVLGLIPGCGPQILFITMFTRGMVPFAAVLANAISQDGDALFPLLVLNRPAALWATLVTTVPALVLGLLVYVLETRTALGLILGR